MSTASDRARVCVVAAAFVFTTACARFDLPACRGDETGPIVSSAVVCPHFADLGCHFEHAAGVTEAEACAAAYDDMRAKTDDVAFTRITTCYAGARSCAEIGACSLVCGAPGVDAGSDTGSDADVDAGADAGSDADVDAGP